MTSIAKQDFSVISTSHSNLQTNRQIRTVKFGRSQQVVLYDRQSRRPLHGPMNTTWE